MDGAGRSGHDLSSGPLDDDVPVRTVLRTTDLDRATEFCHGLFHKALHLRPVGDPAGFSLTADVVQLGPVTLGDISCGTDLALDVTDLESAYHVLAPVSGTLRSVHRGIEVRADAGRAAVYRPVGGVDLRWPASCRLFSVKVDRIALERELTAAYDRQVSSPLPLGASFETGTGPGRTWTALVHLLHAELGAPHGLAGRPQVARRWRELIVSGLALTVEHPYGEPGEGRRPRPVKRTLDAMHADPGHPFTAAELAAVAGVGVRVLQESFRRHVGMSPLAYLRRLRLDGVHAELSTADPRGLTVSEVAYRWGFTHLGRFAGAYRDRFGVAPSQTLRDRG